MGFKMKKVVKMKKVISKRRDRGTKRRDRGLKRRDRGTKNVPVAPLEWKPEWDNIDVLGLIKWDWANSGYRFTQALQKLDLNAVSFKGTPLAYFNYPKQLPTLPILSKAQVSSPEPEGQSPIINDAANNSDLQRLIDNAKVIYLFGTQWITNINIHNDVQMIVQHGGITYRVAPDKCNSIYNPIVSATIAQCPDLLNLGAKNEHLIYYPVDTDLIRPNYNFKDQSKLIIGHFPSSPLNKGTDTINKVIQRLKSSSLGDKFEYNGIPWLGANNSRKHFVDWTDNLKRLGSSDVIIETCKPTLHGKPFGEWGNTAIEASALGSIVVTNSLTPDLYAREYGECALNINNGTEKGLENTLVELIESSREGIQERKRLARRWVVEKHSIEATALRLWSKVFSDMFPDKWDDESLREHAINTWSKEFLEIKGWI